MSIKKHITLEEITEVYNERIKNIDDNPLFYKVKFLKQGIRWLFEDLKDLLE